jgi:endogenous inhibitor of DNA gyrase (YacG/DUF329 family)
MPTPHCPICARPLPAPPARQYGAFCSRRCANIDLGRWFGEHYRVPAPDAPESSVDPALDPMAPPG